MATAVLEKPSTTYPIADEAIEQLAAKYLPLAVKGLSDTKGFNEVHEARMVVRAKRVEIEKTRKELKADALEYGRIVDSEAKRLTALLEPIESHLQSEEDKITKEKERIKAEAEAKRQAAIKDRIDQLIKCGESVTFANVATLTDEQFAAKLSAAITAKKERDEQAAKEEAGRKRVAEEQRIEAERIAKERAELDAQRKAQEEEAARIAAEKKRLADAEAERQRQIELEKAKQEAAEKATRDAEEKQKREAEEARRKAESAAAEKARLEALRPDAEKLASVADAVNQIHVPIVSEGARETADEIAKILGQTEARIRVLAASLTN